MRSRLGLLLLACNLLICSIPRCDFLRAVVEDALTRMQADDVAHRMQPCHESSKTDFARDEAHISQPALCKCELLRFVSTLPLDPIRTVGIGRLSPLTWELVPVVKEFHSTFIPAIDPPYPKV